MMLGALVRTVRSHPDINKAGGILTFTGTVPEEAFALEFDIYEREAQQRISSIVRDLKTAEGIIEAKIYRKSGRVKRGEDIVYVVVAAAHRQEGFKALMDAIERKKMEVPIWKKKNLLKKVKNGSVFEGVGKPLTTVSWRYLSVLTLRCSSNS